MLRRLLLSAWAAGFVVPAVAQPPGGEVMTIRTAGQPDRKVRVLKSDTLPDGTVLKDVKDEATGLVYTIADAPSAAAPPAATPRPQPALPTPPPAPPIQPPPSRPLNGTAFPSTAASPPRTPSQQSPATTPRVPAAQASASRPEPIERQSGVHKLLFGEMTPPPQRPAYAPPPRTAQAPQPPASTERTPLYPPRPAYAPPPQKPLVPEAPPQRAAVRPPTQIDAPVRSLPPAQDPIPVRTTAVDRPPLVAPPVVKPIAEPLPVSPTTIVPVAAVIESPLSPDQQMRAEVGPLAQELKTHLRPSYRIEMANALAEGRYASQDEVKRALAAAAAADPSPQVRGHCVRLLGRLGYADAEFVANLQTWQASDEPAVRLAALDVLAAYAPKR